MHVVGEEAFGLSVDSLSASDKQDQHGPERTLHLPTPSGPCSYHGTTEEHQAVGRAERLRFETDCIELERDQYARAERIVQSPFGRLMADQSSCGMSRGSSQPASHASGDMSPIVDGPENLLGVPIF